MSSLHVRQTKSLIGTPHTTRLVVAGLGLRGIGSEVTVANTPSFRGMVKKVLHLVEVSEVKSDEKKAAPAPAKAAPAKAAAAPAKAAEAKKEPAKKPAKKG
jgi:large subunit ribosomal protein L30